MKFARGAFLQGCFFASIVCYLVFIHVRGFVPHDEGWFLQAALRMLHGDLAYKDFAYLYNPGSLYLNILGFKLFGISILSSRLIALSNSLISVVLIFKIAKLLKLSLLTNFLTILAYVSWGPGHINFVWPVMFCLTGALGSIYLFLVVLERNLLRYYVLLGTVSAAVFVLKQNFGLAIFASILISLMLMNGRKFLKPLVAFSLGYLVVVGIQTLYFITTDTLRDYLNEIYYFTVVKIVGDGILNSSLPWQYPSGFLIKLVKLGLYSLPGGVGVITLGKTLIDGKKLFVAPILLLTFFGLSIRPTTDYIHLAPLLGLMAVCLAVLAASWKTHQIRQVSTFVLLLLAGLGLYSSLVKNYYRWETPLSKQLSFSNNPRTLIWSDESTITSINQTTNFFETHAPTQNELFIYNFEPIYYFILDKTNPTPYDYAHPGVFGPVEDQKTVAILKAKHLPYLMTNIDPESLKTVKTQTADFILSTYSPVENYKEIIIWQSKF